MEGRSDEARGGGYVGRYLHRLRRRSMGKGGAKRMKAGGYDSSYTHPFLSPMHPRSRPAWALVCFLEAKAPRACRPLTAGRRCGRGQYSTDGAMRDSNSQFSVKFYAKFFSCVICSLFIVGMAFYVMNSWLGVSPASRSVCCCAPPRWAARVHVNEYWGCALTVAWSLTAAEYPCACTRAHDAKRRGRGFHDDGWLQTP